MNVALKRNWWFVAVAVIIGLFGVFLITHKPGAPERFVSTDQASSVSFVADSVSQNADIVITVPENFGSGDVRPSVAFEPELEGGWIASARQNEMRFDPKKKLKIGSYYRVTLSGGDQQIQDDFLVAEDPKVLVAFPAQGLEANEISEITIVFNRPMVALTTLDAAPKDVPITIDPVTHGKLRWVSTRNLQFIPEERLVRSSHYTVSIADGFRTVEGLTLPAFSHTFTTRPLRYASNHTGDTSAQQPIRIVFNQLFDLERTKQEVAVKRTSDGQEIAVIAQYGKRYETDPQTNRQKEIEDQSQLWIYQERDRHGRAKFWDFLEVYEYKLAKAYPLEGDIELDESRSGAVDIPEPITAVSAESHRSRFVQPEFFDPEGKLWVSFSEDIDLSKSDFRSRGLRRIEYGEKCKEDIEYDNVEQCPKEPDRKRVSFVFNSESFGNNDQFDITFQKIVNSDGLLLNSRALYRTVRTYPDFRVTKTVPADRAEGADVRSLTLCSTTPIVPAELDTFDSLVKSNVSVGLWRWNDPHRVYKPSDSSPCAHDEFHNTLQYGLIPNTLYELSLSLRDDFGQTQTTELKFTSGDVPAHSQTISGMHKDYTVTTPDRTTFVFAIENLEYVDVSLCRVAPDQFLRYALERPAEIVSSEHLTCTKREEKKRDLPPKYWTRNYLKVPLADFTREPLGHYILTVTNPKYRTGGTPDWQRYDHTLITVTRLAVQEKKVAWQTPKGGGWGSEGPYPELLKERLSSEPRNLYWVTEMETLEDVPNATVQLFQKRKDPARDVSGTTDERGVVLLPAVPDLVGAVVTRDDDSAIVVEDMDRLQWASPVESAERTYLYTDRPIYRPGHEVNMKGIHRIGVDASYEIYQGKSAEFKVYSSKNEVVFEQSLSVSAMGTFAAAFTLKNDAPLGTYRIETLGGVSYFDVEEYVPAAFKVQTSSRKEEYIAGDTAKITIDADYYFGVPLEGGEVEYSLVAQDYYFDKYTDEYFQFGSDWYRWFNDGYNDRYLLRGKALLSKQGIAEISQKLDFNVLFKPAERERSKIVTLFATVKNQNGQAVSTQKSFIVHRASFYAGIRLENSFIGKGEGLRARIKTVDTAGKPRSVPNISASLYKIRWETARRKEVDGGYYYTTEKRSELVRRFSVSTDAQGNGSFASVMEHEGEYEVDLNARDRAGNPVKTVQEFYVSGRGFVQVKPMNNETLELVAENPRVGTGDTVSVVLKSPYKRARALVALERGTIFDYDILDVDQNLFKYQFSVKKEYVPNVYFTALLVSPDPEIKYGQINYQVDTKDVSLEVSVTSDKREYLPGERVRLDFKALDLNGKPVEAELSAAVVDMSVLALKGNSKKNPLVFFYHGMPLTVVTSSNVKNILYEPEIPLGTKGGGGSEPEDLARKKRGVFKDTAFWQSVITTDKQGHASVEFTLPDNLTTWQIESLGVTTDTKLGVGYQEFVSRKELMAVPLAPRFIIPGDSFAVGATLFNETAKVQKLEVTLSSPTLEFAGDTRVAVSVPAKGNTQVTFPVRAPEQQVQGKHTFTISAKNKQYEDTVEGSFPITRNDTYEATATASYSNASQEREYILMPASVIPDKGSLTIHSSATLAVFLTDALKYLFQYPYGCSEQIASKLSSIAIVKRGLKLPNVGEHFSIPTVRIEDREYTVDEVVEQGIARIALNQGEDGGYVYYPGLKRKPSSFYLTLHVVNTLVDLKEAGYSFDSGLLTRAVSYLNRTVFTNWNDRSNDTVVLTAYTISRVDKGDVSRELKKRVEAILKDKAFIREHSSSTTLSYLAMYLTEQKAGKKLKNEVFRALENRIDIDGRGAHIRRGTTMLYDFYETPIKNTALLLKAFVRDHRENQILDKIVRWLLRSRAKDGAWGSSHNTLSVIDAFTDFLEWKRETESEFLLSLALTGKEINQYSFDKNTVLKTYTEELPMSRFNPGALQRLDFSKTNRNELPNFFYYDMSLRYYLPVNEIPARDEGFTVERGLYRLDDEEMKTPVAEARQGEVLKGRLTITVPEARNFVAIEDFIPAGVELVNLRLSTEQSTLDALGEERQDWSVQGFSPNATESHDDRLFLFKERVSPGVYSYEYYVRALVPGKFHHLPAVVSEMYFPENFGRTAGEWFEVKK